MGMFPETEEFKPEPLKLSILVLPVCAIILNWGLPPIFSLFGFYLGLAGIFILPGYLLSPIAFLIALIGLGVSDKTRKYFGVISGIISVVCLIPILFFLVIYVLMFFSDLIY